MMHSVIQQILEKIVQDPCLEARLLNTLSLLELIAARKIGKTVCEDHPSLKILEHYCEESRHAYIFKKLSLDISGGQCQDYLCHDEAVSYFHMLDTIVSEWLTDKTGQNDSYQNYVILSWLVERRALEIYPIYQKLTSHLVVQKELGDIIAEEESHQKEIQNRIKGVFYKDENEALDHCQGIEENFFRIFVSSVDKELQQKNVLNNKIQKKTHPPVLGYAI